MACWAIGFVCASLMGGYVAATLGLIVLLTIATLGDRFLLALFRAEIAGIDQFEVTVVKNISCRLGMERVDVYYSNDFCNIFAFCGPRGKGRVVIGRKLIEVCKEDEIKALLFSAILRIQRKEIRYIQTISLVASAFCFPRYLASFFKKMKVVKAILRFYEFPMLALKRLLIKSNQRIFSHDDAVVRLLGMQEVYASALFKIMHSLSPVSSKHHLFKELAVVEGVTSDSEVSTFIAGSIAWERYERLLR